ncbi:hypothetical protein K239x_15750 [Planctomycetes bacterium K23_9]|uniref:Uncharacterized protein n=1 Tax=Stieleria marina TaxID=1930275 RepID=A0A517NR66_9BACT|nr:hypothetical protein K239x_15750 [Planctomycetes bacterium K23_9]
MPNLTPSARPSSPQSVRTAHPSDIIFTRPATTNGGFHVEVVTKWLWTRDGGHEGGVIVMCDRLFPIKSSSTEYLLL